MTLPHVMQYKVSWKNLLILLFGPNDSSRRTLSQDAGPILPLSNEEMEINVRGRNSEWKFFSLSFLSKVGSAQTLKAALGFRSGGGGFQVVNSIFSAKSLLSPG